jgi:TolB-like protein
MINRYGSLDRIFILASNFSIWRYKMKKIFVASFLFINALSIQAFGFQQDLDEAIKKLADKVAISMAEKNKTKIAVIPFQDLSSDAVTTFGKYIAEELTTALFNSGKFNIVERNLLNKVLDELKLAQSGAVDPSSAKELGKITGVDAVVTGTIQDLVNRVAVNCRLIETQTGNIFAAASEKITKDETIAKLLSQTIENKLTGETGKKDIADKQKEANNLKQKVIAGDFSFELQECKLIGNKITISLLITNIEDDRTLRVNIRESRVIDNNGNVIKLSSILLGGSRGEYNAWADAELPKGIPTKCTLNFDISTEINMISLLELPCGSIKPPNNFSWSLFKAQIRNINISS